MTGFSITSTAFRNLRESMVDYIITAQEAEAIARNHLLDEVEKKARQNPRWVGLADNIDTWDEHDRMWIGVRGPEFVSEAFGAEYGDDVYPPAPLLRTLDDSIRSARTAGLTHLSARYRQRMTRDAVQ